MGELLVEKACILTLDKIGINRLKALTLFVISK